MQTTCPRCGYDLQGVVDSWKTACPVLGTCSECALAFQWSEVLTDRFRTPAWSFEHVYWWRLPKSWFQVLATSWRPWFFWRSLKMTHPIRRPRLWLFTAVTVFAMYIVLCASMATWVYIAYQNEPGIGQAVIETVLFPFSTGEAITPSSWRAMRNYIPTPREVLTDQFADLLLLVAACPILMWLCAAGFVTLPVSRRRAKVRWRHIARIAVYGWTLVVPAILFLLVSRALEHRDHEILMSLSAGCRWIGGGLTVVVVPLTFVWWSLATGRYLKINHAWAVGLAVVFLALFVMYVCVDIYRILKIME